MCVREREREREKERERKREREVTQLNNSTVCWRANQLNNSKVRWNTNCSRSTPQGPWSCGLPSVHFLYERKRV